MESRHGDPALPLRDVTDWRPGPPGEPAIDSTGIGDVLATLRRRKWIVLQCALVVPLAAAIVSLLQQPRYSATASVLVSSARGADDADVPPERRARTEADLARMPAVIAATLRALPSLAITAEEFLGRSSVTPRSNSDILDFAVTDASPERAKVSATAYAREYIDSRPAARRAPATRALLVSPATTAERVQPRPARAIMVGVVLGLILGIAGAYLRNALDTNVRDVREVGALLGLPLLGTIREAGKRSRTLAMIDAPHGPEAEAYRILRANLEFANIDRSARVVLVTGAVDGEGRSTTAANLAVAVALAGRRVVLADLDLRHPVVDTLFRLEGRPGLTDVALGHVALDDALADVRLGPEEESIAPANGAVSEGSLHVLPSGPTPIDSGEFVGTKVVADLVAELAGRADLVLLDAPPLLPVGDARTLTRVADALLVVTNLDLVRRPMLQELARVLGAVPKRVLGFVATGATAEQLDAYGGYYRRHAPRRASERAA